MLPIHLLIDHKDLSSFTKAKLCNLSNILLYCLIFRIRYKRKNNFFCFFNADIELLPKF